jgi:putative oxidoreductase
MDLAYRFLFALPARVGAAFAWLPPLLARVAVGWTFVLTGWGKLHDLDPVIEFFRELGIPYPELQAPFVASVELVCGALLVAGLFSRLAALPLIGTMVVAIATAQWENVDSFGALYGLVEFLYIVVFAWIATAGPGPVALDAFVERALSSPSEAPAAVSSARSFA